MASQPGEQVVAIHILPNISRSKCSQLIEYNMRTFFWKHRQTMVEKLFPDFCLKK